MKASSVSAYLELARWQNCLIAAAGVLFGAWWAGWGSPVRVGFACAAAIALTVYTNATNDAADWLAIDRVAHPERPIPSKRITQRSALILGFSAAAAGVVFSFAARIWLGIISPYVLSLVIQYNTRGKRDGLPGNLTVAVVASLPFLYGAWATGNPRAGLMLVAIAAPLHFAREIAKDIDDQPGDALGGRRTVPIRWGLKVANALILVALFAFAVQIIPVARAWPRLALWIVPALAFSGYAAGRSLRGLPGAPRAFKAAMLCAMAAFVIARA
jgi:geranylgeranylglycerol-phosphate geranylgeranyltransferase